MCGVLTSGAALLFLISAGQWCNAEKGNMPEVSAPEASVSASPQEDVKGGRKHDFESFWENNNATLRLRTSDGLFHQCNWYERDSVNKTGVTLTEWTYIPTTPRWSQSFYGPRYWVFEGSNKMSWSSDEDALPSCREHTAVPVTFAKRAMDKTTERFTSGIFRRKNYAA
uniref:Lipocalin n=1 Tax=Rhipicephalus appendiculatus TaxID=34631 RepID=A0A131YQW7_RHIAP